MSAGDKAMILAQVENQSGGKRQVLMALGIPKSSYYPQDASCFINRHLLSQNPIQNGYPC